MTAPTARVLEVDGQLVLDDPQAGLILYEVGRYNCKLTLALPAMRDRVKHFAECIAELGGDSAQMAVIIINVDDRRGRVIADILMPDHDWSTYRARGETPFARGLVDRKSMQDSLDSGATINDRIPAGQLRCIDGVAVVVIDSDIIAAFSLTEALS